MYNREWERFGEEIRRSVQDAVNSGDFSRLNQTITDTVNGAADVLNHTVNGAADTLAHTMKSVGDKVNQNIENRTRRSAQAGQTYNYSGYTYNYQEKQAHASERRQEIAKYQTMYSGTTPATVGGILCCIFGYGFSFITIPMMFLSISELAKGPEYVALLIISSMMSLGTIGMAIAGTSKLGDVKRFRTYVRELSGKEYCNIEQLTSAVGKTEKSIVKDLKRMIRKGWFRQGHLDAQEKCLMVSHEAYHQYRALVERTEEQNRQTAEEEKAAKIKNERFSPEVRQVLEAGDEYVRKIHACNDAIPGEEISAKIARIEMLVDRIFDRVEQSPESVSELHRMMEYYLPTTVKLLEAYKELDSQPIQGENIVSSKVEIEKTLDTLNVAFEKLLDSMFRDTAWDVSSDISVLHTILAQEGLTEDGLKK